MSEGEDIRWEEDGSEHTAHWRSEAGQPPPRRIVIADDTTTADAAFRLANEGTAMLWRGDFQNARQLLQAIARRIDRKPAKAGKKHTASGITESFHRYRMAQAQRARVLGMLLVPFDADHGIPLRRAPDVREACIEVRGTTDTPYIASLRELLGIIGAHEWRRKGVRIDAIGASIHPHYGVFSPVRGEYIDLVAKAPLPRTDRAFDIGTGTGVLAAVLAKRAIRHVTATDQDPRALACARENISRLGLENRVRIEEADLFPSAQAGLIVCNPPWLPGRPASPLEHAIYDPENRMLRGYLDGLASHLTPHGEGWLILSDFAEHLGLRTRDELLQMIDAARLAVIGRMDTRPRHPKTGDESDPLHAARVAEVTSLWRLRMK